jgi:hypothetical protein
MDRSLVIEENQTLMENYKLKIEKVKLIQKKVKSGTKNCIEIIK